MVVGRLSRQSHFNSFSNLELRSVEAILGNGSLEPVGAAAMETVHRLVFSVASNTGFVIETGEGRELGEVSIRILEEGQNAQALARIPARGSKRIFEQTDRTAHDRGAPITQALTLEVISTGRALDDITIKATAS